MTHHALLSSKICTIQLVDPALKASAAAATSGEVDLAGYNGVAFLVNCGTLDGVLDVAIYTSTTSGGTLSAITGAAITEFTAGQDNKCAYIDLYRPTNRYFKAVYSQTGTTGALYGITAFLYDPVGLVPITQNADVSERVSVVGG